MTIKLGVVMDPIESINFHKDSTLAMLLAARTRGWELYYMEQADLFLQDARCLAEMCPLEVHKDAERCELLDLLPEGSRLPTRGTP